MKIIICLNIIILLQLKLKQHCLIQLELDDAVIVATAYMLITMPVKHKLIIIMDFVTKHTFIANVIEAKSPKLHEAFVKVYLQAKNYHNPLSTV